MRQRDGLGSQRNRSRNGSGDSETGRFGGSEPDRPADPETIARAICLRLLSAAPRTRAELAEALRKRGVPNDAADVVLERFSQVGLIDDAAFSRAWVESRHAGRGLARRALADELRRRGVDGDVLAEAVATIDGDDELLAARALVRRRLALSSGMSAEARTRRLVGMLARKGYSEGLARRVVREELAAAGAPTVEEPADSL